MTGHLGQRQGPPFALRRRPGGGGSGSPPAIGAEGGAGKPGHSCRVGACADYILQHLTRKITLEDLAALAGCDKFQVIRAFRQKFGTTPHAYILEERVARAADLLKRGERAAIVASEVGFVDQSHFIRYFKRHMGVTPKRFVDLATSRQLAESACPAG